MVYLCVHPLPVPMAARITKYLNKYVRRVYQPAILTYLTMVFYFDLLHRSYGMIYGE
jgi:hypothetical protein